MLIIHAGHLGIYGSVVGFPPTMQKGSVPSQGLNKATGFKVSLVPFPSPDSKKKRLDPYKNSQKNKNNIIRKKKLWGRSLVQAHGAGKPRDVVLTMQV